MRRSSAIVQHVNRFPVGREKNYVSVTTIRPFTKPASSSVNYVSTYDVNDESISNEHQPNSDKANRDILKYQETCSPNQKSRKDQSMPTTEQLAKTTDSGRTRID